MSISVNCVLHVAGEKFNVRFHSSHSSSQTLVQMFICHSWSRWRFQQFHAWKGLFADICAAKNLWTSLVDVLWCWGTFHLRGRHRSQWDCWAWTCLSEHHSSVTQPTQTDKTAGLHQCSGTDGFLLTLLWLQLPIRQFRVFVVKMFFHLIFYH